jgi:hypothetical protein
MEVVASYREARFSGWQSFELRPDAVRVRGAFRLGSRFDVLIPLAALRAEPDRLSVLAPGFWLGLYTVAVTALAAALFGVVRGRDALWSPAGVWVFGVAAAGVLAIVWNVRRTEFVRFVTVAGVPAVVVGRVGPQAGEFDRFVALLEEQVRRVGASGSVGPSG